MIKAALKDLAGHVMDQTLEGYLHLAPPNATRAVVRSLLKIYDIVPTLLYNKLLGAMLVKGYIYREDAIMNKATTKLFLTLGILAGIMGIEHGIGEVLEGNRPTDGVFILSWPDSAFFEIMAGEPAMTVIPNYLLTGLLAIFFSCLFLTVLAKPSLNRNSSLLLFALLLLMLLAGAGFGPPILGIIAVLITFKRDSPLKLWSKLPSTFHRILSKLWPWSFGFCLLGWLMLFPGAALIVFFTGVDNAVLMLIPILVAFAFIPITLLLGFSRDLLERKAETPSFVVDTTSKAINA